MKQITVNELAATTDPGVVDVREPDEYAGAHVPGAVNIPLGDLQSRISEIPTQGNVYVICQSGGRSSRAIEMLAGQGRSAVNVDGGTTAWIQAGLQTEK